MCYIYSKRKLICIENISMMERFEDTIILTLDSGRKVSVYYSKNEDDLKEVFCELSKEIRRNENDIDIDEFEMHMKIYYGIKSGTWFL